MSKQIYLFSISSHSKTTQINPLSIDFYKPNIDFTSYDNFIITSKQIAKILNFYTVAKEDLKPALCISKQSAKSYKAIGGEILNIGKGYGDTLVASIKSYTKETKWLYLRAEIVASDFVNVCREDGYNIDESILYSSSCSEEISQVILEDNATLIFTSPSSIECFLKHHSFNKKNIIIVIGKTTAKKLPPEVEYILSKETTIDACVEIALSI